MDIVFWLIAGGIFAAIVAASITIIVGKQPEPAQVPVDDPGQG